MPEHLCKLCPKLPKKQYKNDIYLKKCTNWSIEYKGEPDQTLKVHVISRATLLRAHAIFRTRKKRYTPLIKVSEGIFGEAMVPNTNKATEEVTEDWDTTASGVAIDNPYVRALKLYATIGKSNLTPACLTVLPSRAKEMKKGCAIYFHWFNAGTKNILEKKLHFFFKSVKIQKALKNTATC